MSWTDLHSAAGEGDVESVKRLAKANASLDAKDKAGLAPLHVAAEEGAVEGVRVLCQLGADVNLMSSCDWATPMHKSVEEGHLEVMEVLLESQADVNAENIEGFTPLHEAARAGIVEAVSFLLQRQANINALSKNRSSALHLAILYEHLEVVKTLVEAGADSNVDDEDGRTPADMTSLESSMRALGTWKPTIVLETVQGFVLRLVDRIQKEAGVPLTTPEAALGHARFNGLWNHKEFLVYIDRFQYKDKRLKEVTKQDTTDKTLTCKFLGSYFSCAELFDPPCLKNNEVARHFISLVINKEYKRSRKDHDDDDK